MFLRASLIAAAAAFAVFAPADPAVAAPVVYVFTVTASDPALGVLGTGTVAFDGPVNAVGLQSFTHGQFGTAVLDLQPAPVPGALVLLATGLAGLAAAGRRKRPAVQNA